MADGFDALEEIIDGRETDLTLSESSAGNDLGGKFVVVSEEKMFADSDFSAGAHQALPFIGLVMDLAGEENFDFSV